MAPCDALGMTQNLFNSDIQDKQGEQKLVHCVFGCNREMVPAAYHRIDGTQCINDGFTDSAVLRYGAA